MQFGKYYCDVCHFWDNVDKGQYHCEGCGLCRCANRPCHMNGYMTILSNICSFVIRVGGRENFRHCDRCRACYTLSFFTHHTVCRHHDERDVSSSMCFVAVHAQRTR